MSKRERKTKFSYSNMMANAYHWNTYNNDTTPSAHVSCLTQKVCAERTPKTANSFEQQFHLEQGSRLLNYDKNGGMMCSYKRRPYKTQPRLDTQQWNSSCTAKQSKSIRRNQIDADLDFNTNKNINSKKKAYHIPRLDKTSNNTDPTKISPNIKSKPKKTMSVR